jgi:hypothetical protein
MSSYAMSLKINQSTSPDQATHANLNSRSFCASQISHQATPAQDSGSRTFLRFAESRGETMTIRKGAILDPGDYAWLQDFHSIGLVLATHDIRDRDLPSYEHNRT